MAALSSTPQPRPRFLPRPQPASAELLPACLPFLPLSPLNRLRQQDGTNLWLNSPKITRDLSKAVCVKLTGACTLLSSALSSEAGPGTPLQRCPPAPLPHSTWPCHASHSGSPREGEHRSPAAVPGRGARPRVLLSLLTTIPTNLVLNLAVPRASRFSPGTCVQLARRGRGGATTRPKCPEP